MIARPHANTRTTEKIRAEIRRSPESLRVLAKRYNIDPKTVAKWKKRENSDNLPAGPKPGSHGKLTAEEEDTIVRFREQTLLPLDDCLYALQAHIPHLRRSSLHRCLQRHGISNLAGAAPADGAAGAEGASRLGYLHIDGAEVRSGEGVHYLFNAIDQASKFVFVRMGRQGGPAEAADFLAALAARSPFRIDRVLTLDAAPFVADGGETAFGRMCRDLGIEHRLTASTHPWTRGRGIRMGRMLQDKVSFASEAHLAGVLSDFVHAYNFRRRLKTLRGRTPYEFLCRAWEQRPELFLRDPHHEMVGLGIMPV